MVLLLSLGREDHFLELAVAPIPNPYLSIGTEINRRNNPAQADEVILDRKRGLSVLTMSSIYISTSTLASSTSTSLHWEVNCNTPSSKEGRNYV